jgi:hypothetical protein
VAAEDDLDVGTGSPRREGRATGIDQGDGEDLVGDSSEPADLELEAGVVHVFLLPRS